jgi:hypothetical protein
MFWRKRVASTSMRIANERRSDRADGHKGGRFGAPFDLGHVKAERRPLEEVAEPPAAEDASR